MVIVDYGMGNLGSIFNMLKKIGVPAEISSNKKVIAEAKKLILPGVGSFDNAIKNLTSLDLMNILNKKVLEDKTPILGICLGIQLFTKRSDEGVLQGLGWIDAETVSFLKYIDIKAMKVPHMGWNSIKVQRKNPLMDQIDGDLRYYFVHSYFVKCNDHNDSIALTNYGIEFTSSIQKENIFGVQFHPEKSHRFGMQLLANFAGI